jgi:signal transduction histidine kinase
VTIAVRSTADRTVLTVSDDGPGLPENDRPRAFDRFWRGSGASHDGSGLGLAIVAQLSRASGATAELLPNPAGGLDAVVRFLTANASAATPRADSDRRPEAGVAGSGARLEPGRSAGSEQSRPRVP